ncbi:hypothetical protein [Tepidiforma sp.]|uniref:hypothetical protein n=1 Tax=Tepidiforma sp. TaxID=2682230 RepID=UPI002ADD57C8|nr:hypothetical protein [Tepidiforma sp.]
MRGVLGMALALGLALAACGTPDANFPSETVCPSPGAGGSSRANPGARPEQAFVAVVRTGALQIVEERERLREVYPTDTFFRREGFRPDFAAYADRTICLARELRAMGAPNERLASWKANVDAALDALIGHTEAGREAVRTRNVSEYRAWYRGVDARLEAVTAAANASP